MLGIGLCFYIAYFIIFVCVHIYVASSFELSICCIRVDSKLHKKIHKKYPFFDISKT